MNERPEHIQDPAIAKEFQLAYDDLVDRQIPTKLIPEFKNQAAEMADGSILAAAVVTHLDRIEQREWHDPAYYRKQAIKDAGAATLAVVGLDSFLRDPANRHEPVMYADQDWRDVYDVSNFLHLHFTIADGSWLNVMTRDGRGEPWHYVKPEVQYGVDSTVGHGRVMSGWLQGTRKYDPEHPNEDNRHMKAIGFGYPDISNGGFWHPNYHIDAFTAGSDKVMELFSRMVDKDYLEGYNEHRKSRGGYLLMQQAWFVGHAIFNDMFAAAEEAGVLPVWQRQLTDHIALDAVAKLEQVHAKGHTLKSWGKDIMFTFPSWENRDDIATFEVSRKAIVARAMEHAAQRRLDTDKKELSRAIGKLTGK